MRKILLGLIIFSLAGNLVFAGNNSGYPAIELSEIEKIIFEKINLIRQKSGLNPLKYDAKLARVALAHSSDMVNREFFSHYNPDGKGPVERVKDVGFDEKLSADGNFYFSVAENIGYVRPGYLRKLNNMKVERTPRSLAVAQIKLWLKSKPHKTNMLSKDYDETGIGVAVDKNDNFYATQLFR